MTISYADGNVTGLAEETLEPMYWNGSEWSTDGISLVERNTVQNYVVFTITHLSDFALFASDGVYHRSHYESGHTSKPGELWRRIDVYANHLVRARCAGLAV